MGFEIIADLGDQESSLMIQNQKMWITRYRLKPGQNRRVGILGADAHFHDNIAAPQEPVKLGLGGEEGL